MSKVVVKEKSDASCTFCNKTLRLKSGSNTLVPFMEALNAGWRPIGPIHDWAMVKCPKCIKEGEAFMKRMADV